MKEGNRREGLGRRSRCAPVFIYDRTVFARHQMEKPTSLSYRSDPRTLPPPFLATLQ